MTIGSGGSNSPERSGSKLFDLRTVKLCLVKVRSHVVMFKIGINPLNQISASVRDKMVSLFVIQRNDFSFLALFFFIVHDLKIKKSLPLNQPVPVEFTPKKSGSLNFSCGMNMLKGTVIVQ